MPLLPLCDRDLPSASAHRRQQKAPHKAGLSDDAMPLYATSAQVITDL
jgi:hypothetical protein